MTKKTEILTVYTLFYIIKININEIQTPKTCFNIKSKF